MRAETVIGARKMAQLLDSAETSLNGVSRSMLAADPILMERSQAVLEQLVENLNRVKAAAGAPGFAWAPELRARLGTVQGKLRRLTVLGDVAMSAITLRSERSALSTGGYTAHGAESVRGEISTLSLDC